MRPQSNGAPIAVLGAGIAGLTAATALRRQGVPVVLFEAGPQVAGLARSFHDADGFTYDFGAHFITNRLAAAIGVGAQCRDVRHYGEAVLLDDRVYGYPFGLMKVPRFALSAIAAKLRPEAALATAEAWFRNAYGQALANEVALPLVEAWSGARASELASSVGNKLQGGIAGSILLKLASQLTGRAVASGYSHEMPEGPNVWHVYPDGGVALLSQHLATGMQELIRLNSPVESILVDSGKVTAIRVNGREQEVRAVISTAPCHILARLVTGTNALSHLARFRYRPMVFVNMRFHMRGVLPDTVLWTPGKELPFFRLTEPALSMPWLAPPGKTLVTADIGCAVGDPIWSMADEQLGELCFDSIRRIIPATADRYLGCRVLRTPIAYPVFLQEYEAERQQFEVSTGVHGLYSIGRNGEFAHILMEDVYWRTRKRVSQILSHSGANTA